MSNSHYIIEIANIEKGKLKDGGFLPKVFTTKELCECAVKQQASEIYNKLKNNKLNPDLRITYDSDKIFKGATRVYYKDGYVEVKPFEVQVISDRSQIIMKQSPKTIAIKAIQEVLEQKELKLQNNPYHHKSQDYLEYQTDISEDIERLNEILSALEEIS
jgi:hypothetical protein